MQEDVHPMNARSWGVTAVTLAGTAIGVTYVVHAPLIPIIAGEIGLSDLEAGLVTAALFLAAILTMLAAPGLADRYGPHRTVAAALFLAAAGNGAFALATDLAGLLAAKALGGVGAGMGFLSGTRYIAALYGADRSHFGQGLYGAGYPLGSAIALWAMPPLALGLGWRGAFAVAAAIVVVLVIPLVLAFMRRDPADMGLEPDGMRAGGATADEVEDLERELERSVRPEVAMRQSSFWLLAAAFGLTFAGLSAVL
ncbi:MAG: MFS transporter, partial [Candidatus Limnocylindria bacterium]